MYCVHCYANIILDLFVQFFTQQKRVVLKLSGSAEMCNAIAWYKHTFAT